MLAPLIIKPMTGFLVAGAALVILLAWRSVAWPLAFSGIPTVLFAVFGSNPLPAGGVTLVLGGWIALAVGFVVVTRVDLPPARVMLAAPMIASIVLLAWMVLRLGASAAAGYGQQKIQLFVVGNLAFMFGGIIAGWRKEHLRLLVALVFAVSFAGAAVLCFQFLTGGAQTVLPDRFSISSTDDPISLGRDSAGGLLIGVYLLLTVKSPSLRVWIMATFPVLAISLVASGSRGPVAGAVGGFAVFAALAVTTPSARRRLLLVAGGALASILVVPLVVPGAAVSRSLEVFTASGGSLSSNGRTGLWGSAIDLFTQNTFLGIGTGGFSVTQVTENYPHNIILEAASELGVVGLAAVVVLIVNVASRLVRAWQHANEADEKLLAAVILALFTTGVINSFFSGAIPDNKIVWLWGGAAVGVSARILGAERTSSAAARPALAASRRLGSASP